MITCMKFILLEGQQSEKVVSRCLTSSASSWICTRFQVLRKTLNWLTREKLSWNRFSPQFFSDSKKIDEFRHAKKFLLGNPISSLVVKWSSSTSNFIIVLMVMDHLMDTVGLKPILSFNVNLMATLMEVETVRVNGPSTLTVILKGTVTVTLPVKSTTQKKSSWNPVQLRTISLENGLQTPLFVSDSIDANANAITSLGVNKQTWNLWFNLERYC